MRDFSLVNDGLRLDGTVFYPSSKKERCPAILFVHGWTAERTRSFQYAKALAEAGYICLLFNMRGHGTSTGSRDAFCSRDFLSDVVAAYDYLSHLKGVDSQNISAVGSSYGGYLVSILSSERKLRNLVLRAPADYPDDLFDKARGLPDKPAFNMLRWREKERGPTHTFALSSLHSFVGNLLLIESELDDKIPHQTILNYMNAVPSKDQTTHRLLKGAPHSLKEGKFRDEVTKILVEWFKDRL